MSTRVGEDLIRSVVSISPRFAAKRFTYYEYFPWVSGIGRADEQTRTADLLQLRVINRALQGLAQGCKCRIEKRLSFLCLALYCTPGGIRVVS